MLVPIRDETPRRHPLTSREDSNESMDSEQNRTVESCESDAVLTPTNEPPVPIGSDKYRRESRDSLRARFRSEPNIQRPEHPRSSESQLLKKNVSIEGTELVPFDSPGSQSRSTPNSPELVRSTGHLDVSKRDTSRSTPNTPEVARVTQNKRQIEDDSSDEDQSNLRAQKSADFTSPIYTKHRITNQNPLPYPQLLRPLPVSSHPYHTPSYHKHTGGNYSNSRYSYMPQATGTYPHTIPNNQNLENNVREKPRANQLTRSSASYELSYPHTLPQTSHPRSATQRLSSRPDNVLPISAFQKARVIIGDFPVVQETQLYKLSELASFDVTHV